MKFLALISLAYAPLAGCLDVPGPPAQPDGGPGAIITDDGGALAVDPIGGFSIAWGIETGDCGSEIFAPDYLHFTETEVRYRATGCPAIPLVYVDRTFEDTETDFGVVAGGVLVDCAGNYTETLEAHTLVFTERKKFTAAVTSTRRLASDGSTVCTAQYTLYGTRTTL